MHERLTPAKRSPGTVSGNQASRKAQDPRSLSVADGFSGSASPLPHWAAIQLSFGSHDVSHVKTYSDEHAARANLALGSSAYTSSDRIAFGATPNLRTAAHEAAHIVQQRAGKGPWSGFGRAGDRYERHADEVADTVARGESAAALLDAFVGTGRRTGGAQSAFFVQMQDVHGFKPPASNLGAYESVVPYKDPQFVPFAQSRSFERALKLQRCADAIANDITNRTYTSLWNPKGYSKEWVYGVVRNAIVLRDLGTTVSVGFRVPKSPEIVTLGGVEWNVDKVKEMAKDQAIDFVIEKVEDAATEVLRKKAPFLFIENAGRLFSVLGKVFEPLEFGKGDTQGAGPDILSSVLAVLSNQSSAAKAALERKQAALDFKASLITPKTMPADALRVSR